MEPPQAFLLFFLGFISDFLYCSYTRAISDRKALKATYLSTALEAFKLATAWVIIKHDSTAGAAAFLLGGALGTFISVKNRL